jgi:hypothetical protein
MNPRKQNRTDSNIASFLKRIAAALHPSNAPGKGNTPHSLRILTHPEALALAAGGGAPTQGFLPSTAFRMRCIRLLQEEESLTLGQAAALLELPLEAVRAQFNELRQLKLIESCGVRSTKEGVRTAFCLNPTHPGLEFVLGPDPGDVCISQTHPEDSLLEVDLDSA